MNEVLRDYRKTLSDDRRLLLDRYQLLDAAIKVVGIGSVGRRCWIALLMSANNDPLFLQFKEAVPSVLEPYAGKSAYGHHGERVVMGQRLMQPVSDIFLGWVTGPNGRQFYVRQLRDAKIKPLIETFDEELLEAYAMSCGWVLGARSREGRRDRNNRRLSWLERCLRRSHGTFWRRLCRSGRARPRGIEGRGAERQDHHFQGGVMAGRWMRVLGMMVAAGLALSAAIPALADPAADEAAIRDRFAKWTDAFNAKDPAGVCDLFAPDLIYSLPEVVNGTQATLCGNLAKLFTRSDLKLRYDLPAIHEMIVAGDVAVVRLTWTLTAEANGKKDTTTEEGIDIFRRQPDGRWSIARFIAFTTSPNKALE